MGTTLHTLAPNPGANRSKKRVGRGRASGIGKTSGRGQKGQKARSGSRTKRGFEGGQMALNFRLPKRGFKNIFRKEAFAVNLSTLAKQFQSGVVDIEAMRGKGIIPKGADLVKILATGDMSQSLEVHAHRFSSTAKSKIEAAGGSCVVVEAKKKAPAAKSAEA